VGTHLLEIWSCAIINACSAAVLYSNRPSISLMRCDCTANRQNSTILCCTVFISPGSSSICLESTARGLNWTVDFWFLTLSSPKPDRLNSGGHHHCPSSSIYDFISTVYGQRLLLSLGKFHSSVRFQDHTVTARHEHNHEHKSLQYRASWTLVFQVGIGEPTPLMQYVPIDLQLFFFFRISERSIQRDCTSALTE
jgi:hypothetical protein